MVKANVKKVARCDGVVASSAGVVKAAPPLRYGCDFCGTGAMTVALTALTSHFGMEKSLVHEFSCDSDDHSKKLANAGPNKPRVWFNTVVNRPVDQMPTVDFFQYTGPCQGLSSLGLAEGSSDARTVLIVHSLLYIRSKKPRCFVSEMVATLATQSKNRALLRFIMEQHRNDGYDVEFRLLNTKDHGIPQQRLRFYLIGIRKDSVRQRNEGWGVHGLFIGGNSEIRKTENNLICYGSGMLGK